MLARVKGFIEEHGLVPPGSTVLAGVSGGPDSMALLDVLAALRGAIGFDLACATVDHGLRPEARREATLVRHEARRRSVPFSLLEGRVRASGGGPEEAARDERLSLLAAEARRVGATRIALGHTIDDQAETVILRLARGTGLHGLAAMHPLRDGLYARPLLCVTRAGVIAHLDACGIPWVEDPTNLDVRFARNRVRRDILPALEACQAGAASRIAALADRAREASLLVNVVVRDALGRVARGDGVIDRRAFQDLDSVLRPLVMREAIRVTVGHTRRLGRRHTAAAVAVCVSGTGSASVDLPGGVRVVRAYDEVRVLPGRPGDQAGESVRVAGPGTHRWGPMEIEVLSTGTVPLPVDLRGRLPGDRLAGRSRSLKRLLIDCKVPRGLRPGVPLLARGQEILWAGGLFAAPGSGVRVEMRPAGRSGYLEWLEARR
jgi:tRNA(Ile)-lysidine synthase